MVEAKCLQPVRKLNPGVGLEAICSSEQIAFPLWNKEDGGVWVFFAYCSYSTHTLCSPFPVAFSHNKDLSYSPFASPFIKNSGGGDSVKLHHLDCLRNITGRWIISGAHGETGSFVLLLLLVVGFAIQVDSRQRKLISIDLAKYIVHLWFAVISVKPFSFTCSLNFYMQMPVV